MKTFARLFFAATELALIVFAVITFIGGDYLATLAILGFLAVGILQDIRRNTLTTVTITTSNNVES